MNTRQRLERYQAQNGHDGLTARQRRRLTKKAGTDPDAMVQRDDGMGYPPSMQGYRELLGYQRIRVTT